MEVVVMRRQAAGRIEVEVEAAAEVEVGLVKKEADMGLFNKLVVCALGFSDI